NRGHRPALPPAVGEGCAHKLFPATGVYVEPTMEGEITAVVAWTMPLNCDIAALTVRVKAEASTALAFTVTFPAEVTVIPLVPNLTVLPFESAISIEPGPSFSVTF